MNSDIGDGFSSGFFADFLQVASSAHSPQVEIEKGEFQVGQAVKGRQGCYSLKADWNETI